MANVSQRLIPQSLLPVFTGGLTYNLGLPWSVQEVPFSIAVVVLALTWALTFSFLQIPPDASRQSLGRRPSSADTSHVWNSVLWFLGLMAPICALVHGMAIVLFAAVKKATNELEQPKQPQSESDDAQSGPSQAAFREVSQLEPSAFDDVPDDSMGSPSAHSSAPASSADSMHTHHIQRRFGQLLLNHGIEEESAIAQNVRRRMQGILQSLGAEDLIENVQDQRMHTVGQRDSSIDAGAIVERTGVSTAETGEGSSRPDQNQSATAIDENDAVELGEAVSSVGNSTNAATGDSETPYNESSDEIHSTAAGTGPKQSESDEEARSDTKSKQSTSDGDVEQTDQDEKVQSPQANIVSTDESEEGRAKSEDDDQAGEGEFLHAADDDADHEVGEDEVVILETEESSRINHSDSVRELQTCSEIIGTERQQESNDDSTPMSQRRHSPPARYQLRRSPRFRRLQMFLQEPEQSQSSENFDNRMVSTGHDSGSQRPRRDTPPPHDLVEMYTAESRLSLDSSGDNSGGSIQVSADAESEQLQGRSGDSEYLEYINDDGIPQRIRIYSPEEIRRMGLDPNLPLSDLMQAMSTRSQQRERRQRRRRERQNRNTSYPTSRISLFGAKAKFEFPMSSQSLALFVLNPSVRHSMVSVALLSSALFTLSLITFRLSVTGRALAAFSFATSLIATISPPAQEPFSHMVGSVAPFFRVSYLMLFCALARIAFEVGEVSTGLDMKLFNVHISLVSACVAVEWLCTTCAASLPLLSVVGILPSLRSGAWWLFERVGVVIFGGSGTGTMSSALKSCLGSSLAVGGVSLLAFTGDGNASENEVLIFSGLGCLLGGIKSTLPSLSKQYSLWRENRSIEMPADTLITKSGNWLLYVLLVSTICQAMSVAGVVPITSPKTLHIICLCSASFISLLQLVLMLHHTFLSKFPLGMFKPLVNQSKVQAIPSNPVSVLKFSKALIGVTLVCKVFVGQLLIQSAAKCDAMMLKDTIPSYLTTTFATVLSFALTQKMYSITNTRLMDSIGFTIMLLQMRANPSADFPWLLSLWLGWHLWEFAVDVKVRVKYVILYASPHNKFWGSIEHIVTQIFTLSHTCWTASWVLFGALTKAPLIAVGGSSLYICGCPRPVIFWTDSMQKMGLHLRPKFRAKSFEKWWTTSSQPAPCTPSNAPQIPQTGDARTSEDRDGVNSSAAEIAIASAARCLNSSSNTVMESFEHSDYSSDPNRSADTLHHEHVCAGLQQSIARHLLLQSHTSPIVEGDVFMINNDSIVAVIQIIASSALSVDFQVRGLEFKGTFCHERELEVIQAERSEPGMLNQLKITSKLLSFQNMVETSTLLWRSVSDEFGVFAYSQQKIPAPQLLVGTDARNIYLNYFDRCLLHYSTRSSELIATAQQLANSVNQDEVAKLRLLLGVNTTSLYGAFGSSIIEFSKYFVQIKPYLDSYVPLHSEDLKYGMGLTCFMVSAMCRKMLCGQAGFNANSMTGVIAKMISNDCKLDLSMFQRQFRYKPAELTNFLRFNNTSWGDRLESLVRKSASMALYCLSEYFVEGIETEDPAEFQNMVLEFETKCFVGLEDSKAFRDAALNNCPHLLAIRATLDLDTATNKYSFVTMSLQNLSFTCIKLDHFLAQNLWSSQLHERFFLAASNSERGSIQNMRATLRNMLSTSIDSPAGYPKYVSPIIRSYCI